MIRRARGNHGFTLIEVLVALSLLGVTMATVVALFSSGMKLRQAAREQLSFDRDARMMLEALRDDLANLVPAGPLPLVTADAIVLWRQEATPAGSSLVSYQWSGSAEQDSMLLRLTAPLSVAAVDHDGVLEEFQRWARVFDPAVTATSPLIREDEGTRFGARATLDGLTASWVGYPSIRAAVWGVADDAGETAGEAADETADESTRLRVLVKLSDRPWTPSVPIPDPALRLALMPLGMTGLEAGFWLPTRVEVLGLPVDEPVEEEAS